MGDDKKLLVEKLAEYAELNRFTHEELGGLIRLCLKLERDHPGVQFVVPGGNAHNVARGLQLQAQRLQSSATIPSAEMPPMTMRPETTG